MSMTGRKVIEMMEEMTDEEREMEIALWEEQMESDNRGEK